MTPEGRKWGHKKEITNATKCTSFQIEAKTAFPGKAGVGPF